MRTIQPISHRLKLTAVLLALSVFNLPAQAFHIDIRFQSFDGYMQNDTGWWHQGYYYWNDYRGYIPSNAVVGGYQAGYGPLFVCQTFYYGGVHPGKVVNGNCNISYGGQEIGQPNFRILSGTGFSWRPYNGSIPYRAVPGGYENGRPLFICQARYGMNGVHPGKVVHGNCNIPYGGSEIVLHNFRVLTWRPGIGPGPGPGPWQGDDGWYDSYHRWHWRRHHHHYVPASSQPVGPVPPASSQPLNPPPPQPVNPNSQAITPPAQHVTPPAQSFQPQNQAVTPTTKPIQPQNQSVAPPTKSVKPNASTQQPVKKSDELDHNLP